MGTEPFGAVMNDRAVEWNGHEWVSSAWEALTELAEQGGNDELAQRFTAAQEEEAVHLLNVKRWLAAAQGR